eukprot:m.56379 g.56379  ORF g.56379 m.56379 type:complete len:73 (+) comp7797_c1_seq1:1869-2087(+)
MTITIVVKTHSFAYDLWEWKGEWEYYFRISKYKFLSSSIPVLKRLLLVPFNLISNPPKDAYTDKVLSFSSML